MGHIPEEGKEKRTKKSALLLYLLGNEIYFLEGLLKILNELSSTSIQIIEILNVSVCICCIKVNYAIHLLDYTHLYNDAQ